MRTRAIVLYDADCGFCRFVLGLLLLWDRRRRLWPAPIAGADGDRWLAAMAVEARGASWHLVESDGRVVSGGAGLPVAMAYLPGGWLVAAVLRRAPDAVERAYRWVASHRSLLSRFVPRVGVRRATALVKDRRRERPPVWAT